MSQESPIVPINQDVSSTPSPDPDEPLSASISKPIEPSPILPSEPTTPSFIEGVSASAIPAKAKKERPKLQLFMDTPNDNANECHNCKRMLSALLLRFRHHCRICGETFCGNCTTSLPLNLPGYPAEILVCGSCNINELARQAKEAKYRAKKELAEKQAAQLNSMFEEMRIAFEANDEQKVTELKASIDTLKAVIQKRQILKQQKAEKKRAELELKNKNKSKKSKPKVNGTVPKANGASVDAKSAPSKKPDPKPVDTPESIAQKLAERFRIQPSKLLNPPDPNNPEKRHLLVLDVDYTLFDHKWQGQVKKPQRSNKTLIPEFKRPYLHEFLEECNKKYDIIIWSATGMAAIDHKLTHLGIYDNPRYKVTAVYCKDHMLNLTHAKAGGKSFQTAKPLQVIWNQFPQYSPLNSIHIDDMECNFQLNKPNGLHIQPYKDSSLYPGDTELIYLTKYLFMVADHEPDFTTLNHKKWKEYIIDKLWNLQTNYIYSLPPTPPVHIIDPQFLIGYETSKKEDRGTPNDIKSPGTPAARSLLPAEESALQTESTTSHLNGHRPSSYTHNTSTSAFIPITKSSSSSEVGNLLTSSSLPTTSSSPPSSSSSPIHTGSSALRSSSGSHDNEVKPLPLLDYFDGENTYGNSILFAKSSSTSDVPSITSLSPDLPELTIKPLHSGSSMAGSASNSDLPIVGVPLLEPAPSSHGKLGPSWISWRAPTKPNQNATINNRMIRKDFSGSNPDPTTVMTSTVANSESTPSPTLSTPSP